MVVALTSAFKRTRKQKNLPAEDLAVSADRFEYHPHAGTRKQKPPRGGLAVSADRFEYHPHAGTRKQKNLPAEDLAVSAERFELSTNGLKESVGRDFLFYSESNL
jgi:hypothetical protein